MQYAPTQQYQIIKGACLFPFYKNVGSTKKKCKFAELLKRNGFLPFYLNKSINSDTFYRAKQRQFIKMSK